MVEFLLIVAVIVAVALALSSKRSARTTVIQKPRQHCITELPDGGVEITMNRDHGAMGDKHYTDCVDEVRQLKREGRHEEAITLLLRTIEATERESKAMGKGWGVAPWYYEQLAIVYRKDGRLKDEVAILERYARMTKAPGAGPDKLRERLQKAQSLLGRRTPNQSA